MALGAYRELSLPEVRKLHEAMRNVLKGGTGSMQTRKAEKYHFDQTTPQAYTSVLRAWLSAKR